MFKIICIVLVPYIPERMSCADYYPVFHSDYLGNDGSDYKSYTVVSTSGYISSLHWAANVFSALCNIQEPHALIRPNHVHSSRTVFCLQLNYSSTRSSVYEWMYYQAFRSFCEHKFYVKQNTKLARPFASNRSIIHFWSIINSPS